MKKGRFYYISNTLSKAIVTVLDKYSWKFTLIIHSTHHLAYHLSSRACHPTSECATLGVSHFCPQRLAIGWGLSLEVLPCNGTFLRETQEETDNGDAIEVVNMEHSVRLDDTAMDEANTHNCNESILPPPRSRVDRRKHHGQTVD
jgi:hypothetical protein